MDNEEIADLIAGREEDIAAWERWNYRDRQILQNLPSAIAEREQMIAASRTRIAELKQRMETGQWNEVSM